VRGKGVEAAVVTALARYTIRAAAAGEAPPGQVLGTLNRVLLGHGTDRFCTVALVHLHRADGAWTATVSCGGHPLPILLRNGCPPAPLGRPGTLLGVFEAVDLDESDVVLQPGDTVVLYTDGVTEGRRDGEWFGDDGLEAVLAQRPTSARSAVDRVLDQAVGFQSGHPRDDIVVVAVGVP
jgi:phosphoserine phosphatase RsbU/P